MEKIIKDHNKIPQKALCPLIQTSPNLDIIQLHKINLIGKKVNNDLVNIELSINAYILNYQTIYYNIITNIPYVKDEWIDHPFKNYNIDNDLFNIQIGNYILETETTKKILEDIIIPDNWKKYIKPYIPNNNLNKSFCKKININMVGKEELFVLDNNFENYEIDYKDIKLNIELKIKELENNQINIKITPNIPIKNNTPFTLHPFMKLKNKNLEYISGVLNDTPTIRQMINDLININDFKLQHTYNIDYASNIIANLEILFLQSNCEKTQSQVINDLIKCLDYYWN
jgi:hypothetical protein